MQIGDSRRIDESVKTAPLIFAFLLAAAGSGCSENTPPPANPGLPKPKPKSKTSTLKLPVPATSDQVFAAAIPLPKKGLLLGQTVMNPGDLEAFEKAVDRKVAFVFDPSIVQGQEDVGSLRFNESLAKKYGDAGYVIAVAAYEAYAGHKPFTVDKLIRGEYDAELKELAAGFRAFGKPMMFFTAREPNGVLMPYLGGYGPDGTEGFGWAESNDGGFSDFQPPAGPEGAPKLFEGLGNPEINDGLERMAAAQRYYFDFFKRREGLTNLMFESMGWAIFPVSSIDDPPGTHAYKIWESIDFEVLYPMIADYSDWISLNWHLNTNPVDDDGNGAIVIPLDDFFRDLEDFMESVKRLAPDKPVIVTELGFPGPNEAEKVGRGMSTLLSYPQVKGVALWGSGRGGEPDQLIRPDTEGAKAFRALIEKYPDAFHPAP
ncbi:MAG: hypothetical protein ACI8UO_000214 [Verrucomicrobiales bacterium]